MLRQILIRPTGQTYGGEVMAATASDLGTIYSTEEQARLAIGLTVTRPSESGMVTHIDLLAFHNRHATPELRGTTLLRRLLSRAMQDGRATPQVAA